MLGVTGFIVLLGVLPGGGNVDSAGTVLDDTMRVKFSETEEGTLRHLLVLHRHGTRTVFCVWRQVHRAGCFMTLLVCRGTLSHRLV